ncbi:MAG: peptide chain release factor N(5)-glutamine methyltransferase [Lachnospiraceae bacterium]|nr:peptide chain release factor N(5)-glutamine methyltransferase [Lachnospiraceae bacterium]
MTLQQLYQYGIEALTKAQVPDAKVDAYLLLEAFCETNRTELYAHGDKEVEADKETVYREMIARRCERIPLQHLLGYTEFMGLRFAVSSDVLCPRPDTEILVEEAMRYLHDGYRILDVCTGSGCILLSLLHYSNDCVGVGVDLSEEALAVACKNREALGIEATFQKSDLFAQVDGLFEMIVSNPPYIKSAEIKTLMPEVRDHEPRMALDGAADGLFFYQKIIPEAREHLCGGGMLFLEIGADQGSDVRALMEAHGYRDVEVIRDLAGLDRVVLGTKG